MPGFLEDLRRKIAADEQSRLQRENDLKPKEKVVDRIDMERYDRMHKLTIESKAQFYESGMGDLINELSELEFISVYEEAEGPLNTGDVGSPHKGDKYSGGDSRDYSYRSSDENHVCRIEVSQPESGYEAFVHITTHPNGTIIFEGEERSAQKKHVGLFRKEIDVKVVTPLRIEVDKNSWKGNRGILEDALGKAYKNPIWKKMPGEARSSGYGDEGPCLPDTSLISIPSGHFQIKDLKIGNLVWTVDQFGNKVQAKIIKTNRRIASENHKMAHIILEDGRKLVVSPGHPTIDNKELGSLKKGQALDGSRINSIQILPYKEKYTYDILPAGDTGTYWTNGILIGSTLSPQFKNMQEKKLNKQIPWHSRLFA